ncbi:cysteine desulfurase family protein [Viridibacillus arvi]|uniref:cysteine desulfurase family protein n=1 Tax=Viridibacillus arvi TaxID=263475 RepID=UPI0034CEA34B
MLYLDNSATTKIHPEVREVMLPYLLEEFGNPSSKYYNAAENAKIAVDNSRKSVAKLIGCHSDEVIFTSGSTESNNMFLKGVAHYYSSKGKHIITSKVEHPSILETCNFLEKQGFDITYLPVDNFGRINISELVESLRNDTILVSIMWGNNELGSLNDIKTISDICANHNIYFHTDATQVVGKIKIDLEDFKGITFLSCSSHKFHGPKGIGAAFIRQDEYRVLTPITPLLHGGGQEKEIRSGTLAVHNIVGLGKAAQIASNDLNLNIKNLKDCEKYLSELLSTKFGANIKFNHDHKLKIPGILSVQFKGINNEILLKKLAPIIAASTGSACSSSKPSHVLSAIGLTLDEIRSTIRFSLSSYTKKEELDIFKSL